MMHDDGADEDMMSLRPLLPWLLLAAALSVSMMVLGAGRGDRILPALAAGIFAALVVGTGLGINAPLWSKARAKLAVAGALRSALRCNVWLAALVYAWGAFALFGIYSLSDLAWRHSFQYASGASLIAAGLAIYGLRLGRDRKAPFPHFALSLVHGAAAAGGLVYLVGAGKLASLKQDWAANEVFLWGGMAIVALCAITALSQTRPNRA